MLPRGPTPASLFPALPSSPLQARWGAGGRHRRWLLWELLRPEPREGLAQAELS